MSGETGQAQSGWTTGTLHKHLSQRITDLDRALSRRMDDADKAVGAALAANEKRFEGVNEFRKALSDQTATFLGRPEYNAAHQYLIDRVNVLTERMAALELRLTSRLDQGEGEGRGTAESRTTRRLDTGTNLMAASVLIGFLALALALYAALHH